MDSRGSGVAEDRAAPTRQKSCNACVRGKRRCDKRTPRCSRCAAKSLDCVYQRRPPRQRGPRDDDDDGGGAVPGLDMAFDMADALGSDASPDSLLGGPPPPLDFSIVDLLASTGADAWNLPGYYPDGGKMDLPPLPSGLPAAGEASPPALVLQQQPQHSQPQQQQPPPSQPQQRQGPPRDLSLLRANEDACLDADPLHVHDPRTRLGFIVTFLSSMPATLSATRALPFMHPRLWAGQLPRSILSAFGAAAAYGARSPGTRAWTVRLIADAARDIHRKGDRPGPSRLDKLARVQALTVVDAMRVFDGDVGLRAAAERGLPLLFAWTKELAGLRYELEHEAMAHREPSRDVPPKSWESLIFLESARRSILDSYALMCVFCLLRSEKPDCDMWTRRQGFTASKHLWDATSSVEFYRAWREKPQYWIENLGFKDFWMYGRAADLDDFTRLMLTSHVGVDAMDHFTEGDIAIPM